MESVGRYQHVLQNIASHHLGSIFIIKTLGFKARVKTATKQSK